MQVVADSEFVHSLYVPRSVDVDYTCLDYAVINNNIPALKILVDAINNQNKQKRAKPTQISLKTMETGEYNWHSRVRTILLLTKVIGVWIELS